MKIDLRNVPDAEVSGIDLANVDITVTGAGDRTAASVLTLWHF